MCILMLDISPIPIMHIYLYDSKFIKSITYLVIPFHVHPIYKNGQFFIGFRCNRVDEVDQGVREKSICQGLAGT